MPFVQERRGGVNPLPVADEVAKACSTSPKTSSSDGADGLPKKFWTNSLRLHRGSDCHHMRWPALVATTGGGTAARADAAAAVRQCWGDLLEPIASEQY